MLRSVQERNRQQPAFGVVILAAGSSRRMGQAKLLLAWGDTTVLGCWIQTWQRLGARQIAIVCTVAANNLQNELDRLGFPKENRIINPTPERGMFGSIQCAAAWPGWNAGLTHCVIALGDQPHLRLETLRALLDCGAADPARICQPLLNGRRRHPVWMPKRVFVALANCAAADLKQFLEARPDELAGFESDDAGLDLDLDTPEGYERARRLHFRA
jgi:molybdenum cofactor cytidylyltransferase